MGLWAEEVSDGLCRLSPFFFRRRERSSLPLLRNGWTHSAPQRTYMMCDSLSLSFCILKLDLPTWLRGWTFKSESVHLFITHHSISQVPYLSDSSAPSLRSAPQFQPLSKLPNEGLAFQIARGYFFSSHYSFASDLLAWWHTTECEGRPKKPACVCF